MTYVPQPSDFPVVQFVECSLFFSSTRSSHLFVSICSNKPAISSHNFKIIQPHVSWKKQKANGYIYSKKFKRARKLHTKPKEQKSSSVRVETTVRTILKRSSTEKRGRYGVTFTTSIKSGLLKALERQPIERIHSMQYDFKYLKQRAQNTGKKSY